MSTTGYLTSFAATYQLEGVTEHQAKRIASQVQAALESTLADLVGQFAPGSAATVLHARVETRGSLVEEYER
ncbi:hypothetical protein [Mycolicibacterium mucogenicum]|uniref:Uncharacterized protein n=1 Tax=Mycolicibacterium mucogenicum DSM 44124 TaxID=1226753 RepID=A0A8H2JAQ8_MYCMU|nr:hypothetical protein [Mycolicibacterium mucogenicum]KAB7761197.1 hypothetical protein MMUC44124_01010 [Mycolicibacterium mucogenicum DSM 44124]QPG70010.1 hypothetical protein C1S78_002990 [Mycolicibacterium mucogenicum DSM 44124]